MTDQTRKRSRRRGRRGGRRAKSYSIATTGGEKELSNIIERVAGPIDPNFHLHRSSLERRRLTDNQLENPYGAHPWVYACAASVAWNIAQVPFRVVQENIEGEDILTDELHPSFVRRKRINAANKWSKAKIEARLRAVQTQDLTEIENGPWASLLDEPNEFMTLAQMWECIFIELTIRGQAFIVKEGMGAVIQEGEVPRELNVFSSRGWEPVIDPQFKILLGWQYTPVGAREPTLLPLRSVVQLKRWNPQNPLGGQGNLAASLQEVRQDVKASSWNEQFFDDGASPGGVLETSEDLSAERADRVRQTWENRHRGQMAKGWRVAILTGGMKYVPTQQSHTDMGFLNQRQWNKEAIQATFKVPDSELTVFKSMTYANALAADRGFWTKTLIPWMRYVEGVFANKLFTGEEFGLFDLSTVEALSAILQDSLTAAESLQRLGYPLNVINERLGLQMPDVPHGDEAYTTLGTISFSDLNSSLEEQFGPVEPTASVAPKKSGDSLTAKRPAQSGRHGGSSPPTRIKQSEPRIGGPRWEKIINQAQVRGERRMQTVVRKWMFDALTEQLKRIRIADREGDLERARQGVMQKVPVELSETFLDFIMFNREEFDQRMQRGMRPEYDEVAILSHATVVDDVGGVFAFDLSDPRMLEFLAAKESDIVRVSQRVHTNVREELLQGLQNGENVTDLQSRIRRAFNFQATPARTLTIARTESAQTMNGTRDLIFQAEGVELAEWVTAGDEAVRPDHRTLGQSNPQELGFNYMTLLGQSGTLRFPADPRGPANQIINCRCVHLPLIG